MSCGGCHNEFPIHTKKKNKKKERKKENLTREGLMTNQKPFGFNQVCRIWENLSFIFLLGTMLKFSHKVQSSKWKFWFTGPNKILEFIFIYNVFLNKNWKIYWSEQSFTGLGPEERCLSWGLIGGSHLKFLINTNKSHTFGEP